MRRAFFRPCYGLRIFFFFQAEDGIRDIGVTGVQTCALPIWMYDETLGKVHFWLTFVFFNATFAPMHLVGVEGMPRRVYDYAEEFADWNLFISISSFIVGLSTLIFAYNMVSSWRAGPRASANPWRGLTLEWQGSRTPSGLK